MTDDAAGSRLPIPLAAMFTAGAVAVHLAVGVLLWRARREPVKPGRWRRAVVLAST